MRNDERLFGDAALSTVRHTYTHSLSSLLSLRANTHFTKTHRSAFPFTIGVYLSLPPLPSLYLSFQGVTKYIPHFSFPFTITAPPPPQGVKYPKSAYWYLQLLLGQKFDSPLVTKYRQWFPYYDMKKDEERGRCIYSAQNCVLHIIFPPGTILFQHDR